MKHFKGFTIIIIITFIGEIASILIPFPIPASIYAFLLIFISLQIGLIKEETIAKPSALLIEIMPLFFVPAAVGIIDTWVELKQDLVYILIIICISTLLVALTTGKTAQLIINAKKKNGGKNIEL